MAKKCELCGKNASFLEGGGKFRDKTVCRECYDKAASIQSEEELVAMGFNEDSVSVIADYKGQFFISALRVFAWIELIAYFVFTLWMWSMWAPFSAGFVSLVTAAIIFTVLYALSYILENVIAIRINLESKDKANN